MVHHDYPGGLDLIDARDGSWAQVDPPEAGSEGCTVREGGPRRLWGIGEQSYEFWRMQATWIRCPSMSGVSRRDEWQLVHRPPTLICPLLSRRRLASSPRCASVLDAKRPPGFRDQGHSRGLWISPRVIASRCTASRNRSGGGAVGRSRRPAPPSTCDRERDDPCSREYLAVSHELFANSPGASSPWSSSHGSYLPGWSNLPRISSTTSNA